MIEIDEAAPDHSWAFPGNSQERAWLEHQISGGKSWYAYDEHLKAIALFGLYQLQSGDLEAWFRCTFMFSPRGLPLVLSMRRLFREHADKPTICTIRPGHAPGERLARLLGFAPTGEIFNAPATPLHGVQFWRYEP